MKKFFVKLSNFIGTLLIIVSVLCASIVSIPLLMVLWLSTRFIVDENGSRKYNTSTLLKHIESFKAQ